MDRVRADIIEVLLKESQANNQALKEQYINDGGGLYVRVRSIADGGDVSFRFRYRLDGKQSWLTLKASDLVEARAERDTYT